MKEFLLIDSAVQHIYVVKLCSIFIGHCITFLRREVEKVFDVEVWGKIFIQESEARSLSDCKVCGGRVG